MQQQNGQYGSALVAAAACGQGTEIVKFLVNEAGAEANMQVQGGDYGSALAAAACCGNIETVKLLLQAGVDANIQVRVRVGNALAAVRHSKNIEKVAFGSAPGAAVWGGTNQPLLFEV
ncbi:ankyrin repeat-containing domain protein [Xylariaceae sp. AK1471]|nr:ankyrin repeat-containing domain protein [Xylariaceae sp. AK1471]